MRPLPYRLLIALLTGLLLSACQDTPITPPAGPPAPHGIDDVVRVLEEAGFEVTGGDALAAEETGSATLRADDVPFRVTIHPDEATASASGGRRYGNVTFTDLNDALEEDFAIIDALADGLSGG